LIGEIGEIGKEAAMTAAKLVPREGDRTGVARGSHRTPIGPQEDEEEATKEAQGRNLTPALQDPRNFHCKFPGHRNLR
jgi:hypothetical protein